MPINKLSATRRGKSAVAAALFAAVVSGWTVFVAGTPPVTPTTVRAAIAKGITPPAVDLAITRLIKPWEHLALLWQIRVTKRETAVRA